MQFNKTNPNNKYIPRDQIKFPNSLSNSGSNEAAQLYNYNDAINNNINNINNSNNNINNELNSRDQIQNGLNQRQNIPMSMNYPINNSNSLPYIDRQGYNQQKPVQTNMHSSYEFDKLNFMNISNHINTSYMPLDTRIQNYETKKQNDDLFYKNHQGNLHNFYDNKPAHTRLNENKQNTGINPDLLPKRTLNISKDMI